MRVSWRLTLRITIGVAAIGAAVGFLTGPISAEAPGWDLPALARTERRAGAAGGRTFPGLDPLRHRVEDGVTVADLADGSTAVLSLDPGLQAHLEGVFERYEVPSGAAVAIEPSTGRVLAYVSHSSADPATGDLVLDPTPPAASVFKIVTGAALIDAGVNPGEEVCYHGGASRLTESDLEDDPERDRRCASLTDAMGGSINSVFAKLAVRHLDASSLERYAAVFGFGESIPFDVSTRLSASEVPRDRLEFARAAAGFWHMHMSPLHGALIAATIANDGNMPRPTLVDQVIGAGGAVTYEASHEVFREVIPAATARAVGAMMRATVTSGTGRSYFFDRRGNGFLPGIAAAGKTGTLAGSDPYRMYTWFVGFAPVESPEIAVAALVVNEPRWRIKGGFVAREALRYWLVERPRALRREARVAEQAIDASAAEADPVAAE